MSVPVAWKNAAEERGLTGTDPIRMTWGTPSLPMAGPRAAAAESHRFSPLPGLAPAEEADHPLIGRSVRWQGRWVGAEHPVRHGASQLSERPGWRAYRRFPHVTQLIRYRPSVTEDGPHRVAPA